MKEPPPGKAEGGGSVAIRQVSVGSASEPNRNECQSPAAIAPGEIVAVGGDVLPRYISDEEHRQCSDDKGNDGYCQIGLSAEHLTKR